mmetsp:Transcript_13326/g.27203  ORF Transcript_13326/g.27203 Transcript_13326/m.27203 type:complete len:371 (-) Transcript_13326:39-1151(-)
MATVRPSPGDSSVYPHIPSTVPYIKSRVKVKSKFMAYLDVPMSGMGGYAATPLIDASIGAMSEGVPYTFVLVHGNPTSSYMWRNVIPRCSTLGRVVAPDLIGYGDSDKIGVDEGVDRYSLERQCDYFNAFMEGIGVKRNVIIVGHSWGGTIGAYWASQNKGAVEGVVSMEVVYKPFKDWNAVPSKIRAPIKMMLMKPIKLCRWEFDVGRYLIMNKNLMIKGMGERVMREWSNDGEEMRNYMIGFTDANPECRRPILSLVRSIPVAGSPPDVVRIMDVGRDWLVNGEGRDKPKLFISVLPGTMTEEDRGFMRGLKECKTVELKGKHMITEDDPEGVGREIVDWFKERISKTVRRGSVEVRTKYAKEQLGLG